MKIIPDNIKMYDKLNDEDDDSFIMLSALTIENDKTQFYKLLLNEDQTIKLHEFLSGIYSEKSNTKDIEKSIFSDFVVTLELFNSDKKVDGRRYYTEKSVKERMTNGQTIPLMLHKPSIESNLDLNLVIGMVKLFDDVIKCRFIRNANTLQLKQYLKKKKRKVLKVKVDGLGSLNKNCKDTIEIFSLSCFYIDDECLNIKLTTK